MHNSVKKKKKDFKKTRTYKGREPFYQLQVTWDFQSTGKPVHSEAGTRYCQADYECLWAQSLFSVGVQSRLVVRCLKNLRPAVASLPHKISLFLLFIYNKILWLTPAINCTCFLICRPINLNNELKKKKKKKKITNMTFLNKIFYTLIN